MAVVATACGSGGGDAENYPNQDIRLIVHAAASGPSDLSARTAAKTMEKELDTRL